MVREVGGCSLGQPTVSVYHKLAHKAHRPAFIDLTAKEGKSGKVIKET